MKAGLRDPSLEALQNGLSAQTRPKSGHVEQTVGLKCIIVESSSGSCFLVKIQCN